MKASCNGGQEGRHRVLLPYSQAYAAPLHTLPHPAHPCVLPCLQVCHAGKCGACKLAGPKACPCGKTQLPEAACDVVVPPCGETCEWERLMRLLDARMSDMQLAMGACSTVGEQAGEFGAHLASPVPPPAAGGKLLSCGVHVCHERCHTGPCPQTCRETVVRSCECGKTQRTMQARVWQAAHMDCHAPLCDHWFMPITPPIHAVTLRFHTCHPICTAVPGGRVPLRAALHQHAVVRAAPLPPPLLRWRELPALRGSVRKVAEVPQPQVR